MAKNTHTSTSAPPVTRADVVARAPSGAEPLNTNPRPIEDPGFQQREIYAAQDPPVVVAPAVSPLPTSRVLVTDRGPRWGDIFDAEGDAASDLGLVADRASGQVVGHIQIHDGDDPLDVLRRARALLSGHISPDRATRFRADALLRVAGGREIAPGTTFSASELSEEERRRFFEDASITPIA